MPPTATSIFAFVADPAPFSLGREEVVSEAFDVLRKNLRAVVLELREVPEPEAVQLAETLAQTLSRWLTIPVPFEKHVIDELREWARSEKVMNQWGRDIAARLRLAGDAGDVLCQHRNPLSVQVAEAIYRLSLEQSEFRIFCHRGSVASFQLLSNDYLGIALGADLFIHSAAEYRLSSIFSTLLKVGPLRSRGWGCAPDAILTAPRFRRLVQIVWASSQDEDGFGFDPISPHLDERENRNPSRLCWARNITVHREPGSTYVPPAAIDDFALLYEHRPSTELRTSSLLHLPNGNATLYPSREPVFSLERGSAHPMIALRTAEETLKPGMYLICPYLDPVEFGAVRANEGSYSKLWKQRLREEMAVNPQRLVAELRRAGIDLLQLRSCLERWCKPATTVIHAPQRADHFETLIQVLEIESESPTPTAYAGSQWWRLAWNEIRRSRGEAVQTGLQGQEIVDEELARVLEGASTAIEAELCTSDDFEIALLAGQSLQGAIRVCKILEVEHGFGAPETAMRIVTEMEALEQWRV